jgi:hypothetical protein
MALVAILQLSVEDWVGGCLVCGMRMSMRKGRAESDKNKKLEVRRGSSVFIPTSRAGGEIGGQKGGSKLAVSGDDRADQ